MEEYILFVSSTRFCTFLEKNLWKAEFSSCSRLVSIGAKRWEHNRLELCRTREELDYRGGGGMGFDWCWGNSPSSLYTGRSVHIGSDRFWLNDSSEALFRKRINSWAGVPQRNGVKLVQSSYPLFILCGPPNVLLYHLLASLNQAMIYPQLAQPSTPGSSLHFIPFTCHHNLLCHSDLPGLSHSKQTTTHGSSQDVSCPFAQFSPAKEKAIGLTVGGQSSPSSSPPLLSPDPWKHVARWSSLLCGQQKHFSSWAEGIK